MSDLTPGQAFLLWRVLGRQGSARQMDLTSPEVDAGQRRALIAAGYLEAEGRPIRLTVTDKGWDWAGRNLRAPLPPGQRALQDWLARIHRHLDATGASLADLVGPAEPEPVRAPAPKPGKAKPQKSSLEASKPRKPAAPRLETKSAPRKTAPVPIRARIEEAYLALTGGQRAVPVRLSALRAHLAGLDRDAVDAGLAAILRGDPTASLSQFSDPRSLDAAEREATFAPAGEPFHILRIRS